MESNCNFSHSNNFAGENDSQLTKQPSWGLEHSLPSRQANSRAICHPKPCGRIFQSRAWGTGLVYLPVSEAVPRATCILPNPQVTI